MNDEVMKAIEQDLGDAQVKCLRVIVAAGADGLICEEVESKTGLRHQTASARVKELSQKGLIVDKGIRRPTKSNRGAIVWVFKAPA